MDLNVFERAIASISPHWGVRRIGEKLALQQSLVLARGYDAARRDRRTSGWQASGGSANTEMAPALGIIRRRSRDLVRNNEWGGNAKRKTVAHMVGPGLVPRAASSLPKTQKKKAADLWSAFSENCDPEGLTDIYGIQARAAGEVFEGGACFIRWYARSADFGLKVPLQCEVLEHDHLDLNKTLVTSTGAIVNGVEYDSFGRRIAYWLFPQHPGDYSIASLKRGRLMSERISADFVDHIFRVDRTGQVTGVPWLAPVMLRLRDTADYEEAELVRKKIEACLTVFVRRSGTGATSLAQANRQSVDEKGSRLEKIAPGMIAYLKDGEDITAAVPSPASGYADHLVQQWLACAAGIGITYSMFSGDLRQTNYSSMREGKIDFWATLDQWQWHFLIPQMGRKMWRRAMLAAAGRGHAIAGDIAEEWAVPKRPWVDPEKDLKAKNLELALGLTSWSDEVAAAGYDPAQQIEKIVAERKELEATGITFSLTPGQQQPADAGAEPAPQK